MAHLGEKRNACRALVGTPEGETPLGSRRRRKENNKKLKKQIRPRKSREGSQGE
jgi:hypothetical protein